MGSNFVVEASLELRKKHQEEAPGRSHVHHAGSRVKAVQRHICSTEAFFNPVVQT